MKQHKTPIYKPSKKYNHYSKSPNQLKYKDEKTIFKLNEHDNLMYRIKRIYNKSKKPKLTEWTEDFILEQMSQKYKSYEIIKFITNFMTDSAKKYNTTKLNIINCFNDIFNLTPQTNCSIIKYTIEIKSPYYCIFYKLAMILKSIIKYKSHELLSFIDKFIKIAGINWIKFVFIQLIYQSNSQLCYTTNQDIPRLLIELLNKYGFLLYSESNAVIEFNYIYYLNLYDQEFNYYKFNNLVTFDYTFIRHYVNIYGILYSKIMISKYQLSFLIFIGKLFDLYGVLSKINRWPKYKININKMILIYGKY
jgi:hypothetical protein